MDSIHVNRNGMAMGQIMQIVECCATMREVVTHELWD